MSFIFTGCPITKTLSQIKLNFVNTFIIYLFLFPECKKWQIW